MKKLITVLCFLTAAYCIYFPFSYFKGNADKREIKISHILVDTQEDALKIKTEIENGKKFEEAAKEYSICPSKDDGGDLGYDLNDGRLLPEFEKAAFKLPLRKVSDPIRTKEGWHLVKIYDIVYFSDRKNFDPKNL